MELLDDGCHKRLAMPTNKASSPYDTMDRQVHEPDRVVLVTGNCASQAALAAASGLFGFMVEK